MPHLLEKYSNIQQSVSREIAIVVLCHMTYHVITFLIATEKQTGSYPV